MGAQVITFRFGAKLLLYVRMCFDSLSEMNIQRLDWTTMPSAATNLESRKYRQSSGTKRSNLLFGAVNVNYTNGVKDVFTAVIVSHNKLP